MVCIEILLFLYLARIPYNNSYAFLEFLYNFVINLVLDFL